VRLQGIAICCALGLSFAFLSTESLVAEEWTTDYGTAYKAAQQAGKPLLVVLEKPAEPRFRIEQVSVSASKDPSALLEPYELCRIDVTTSAGGKMAELFGATEYPHIAITDKRVDQIVYRNTGKFSDLDWATMLVTYRNGTKPQMEFAPIRSSGRMCFT